MVAMLDLIDNGAISPSSAGPLASLTLPALLAARAEATRVAAPLVAGSNITLAVSGGVTTISATGGQIPGDSTRLEMLGVASG